MELLSTRLWKSLGDSEPPMVNVTQYLKTNTVDSNPLPFLNSLFINRFSALSPYGEDQSFKTFMKWARKSPQILSFIRIIASDILSDEVKFVPAKEGASGRNMVLRSESFWMANKGRRHTEAMLYDLLLLGWGLVWLGKLNQKQVKEFCETVVGHVYPNLEAKEKEFKATVLTENLLKEKGDSIAKKLRHLPASTVTKHTDEYETLEYFQRVGGKTKTFDPEEVIEFEFMPFDGKIYPFPPMEALLSEVYLLWLISQNYVSLFENGGAPDKVFILPNELAKSKNHRYLINTLRKYKKIQNKHGNLVFTGDLKIEDLQKLDSTMENKDLALYIVGILAMYYGIPAGRIPFLIGKAANMGDAGGLADSGYWRIISVIQTKIEEGYNSELWIPFFGTKMKFGRGYKQDEVRETQNEVTKNSVVEQRMRLGLWTATKGGEYLGIDPEEITRAQQEKEKRDKEAAELKTGMMNQEEDNQGNVINEPDKKVKNKRKQDTQNQNQAKAGGKKINP